jgi:pimeloyl-ACP methyl ester carboxylesterase
MRYGIAGFIVGVVLVLLALFVVRQRAIHAVEYELNARFDHYVFAGPEFPQADFEMGRTVHRLMFPTRITTTFYDGAYNEVQRADKPGRYGAVVTMKVGGVDGLHRFVTLYRTPGKISWPDSPEAFLSQLGFSHDVIVNQQREIASTIKKGVIEGDNAGADFAILLAGLSETAPTDPPAVARTDAFARDDAWWAGLREKLGLAPHYPVQVYLPHGYDADPAKKWPLIYYLTTGAENGTDLQRVRSSSLGLVLEHGKQIPAVVIAPQCPLGEDWSPKALSLLLDQMLAKYRIDPDQISLTGGGEVWTMALYSPERFSAILPIDGDTDPADAARLKDVPVWAFHGAGDVVTPVSTTTDMLDAIRQAGGHTHLTITNGDGDIWDEVYATEPIYPWMLAQKRGQPEVAVPGVP